MTHIVWKSHKYRIVSTDTAYVYEKAAPRLDAMGQPAWEFMASMGKASTSHTLSDNPKEVNVPQEFLRDLAATLETTPHARTAHPDKPLPPILHAEDAWPGHPRLSGELAVELDDH
jgi:hypothetical protein